MNDLAEEYPAILPGDLAAKIWLALDFRIQNRINLENSGCNSPDDCLTVAERRLYEVLTDRLTIEASMIRFFSSEEVKIVKEVKHYDGQGATSGIERHYADGVIEKKGHIPE